MPNLKRLVLGIVETIIVAYLTFAIMTSMNIDNPLWIAIGTASIAEIFHNVFPY